MVRPAKMLNIVLFFLEWGTMLYFIPLLIYLAGFSFGAPGVGLAAGIFAVVHYYIYRWYCDRGSLVYFGISIIAGSLGAALTIFFDIFKTIFFPAKYLYFYSQFILPQVPGDTWHALYYYYVFLIGIVYTAIGKFLLQKVLVRSDVKISRIFSKN